MQVIAVSPRQQGHRAYCLAPLLAGPGTFLSGIRLNISPDGVSKEEIATLR